MRKCVVLAGWITSDLASPTLARCEKTRSALDEPAGPARAAALEVEAEHRAAALRQQPLRRARGRGAPAVPDRRPMPPADAPPGTRRPCACCRRGAPCAAAASRCPAGSGRRSSAPCRRRSRAGPRAARAAGRRRRGFLGEVHAVEARVGLGQRRELACACAAVPVEACRQSTSTPPMATPWPRQELGRRVEHQVGAVIERPHQIGRGEGRVDQQRQAVLVRDRRDARDVEHVEAGVAQRLAEAAAASSGRIAARQASRSRGSTKRGLDAEARQRVVEQVVRAAVERARGDDVRRRRPSAWRWRGAAPPGRWRWRSRRRRLRARRCAPPARRWSDWRCANRRGRRAPC